MLSGARIRIGMCARNPSATIDQPSAQRMVSITAPSVRLKKKAKRSTVSSSTTSHSPRVQRKDDSSPLVRPRCSQSHAPRPAVNMKVGAQK